MELKNPEPHVEPPDWDWLVASSWVVSAVPDLMASVTSTP
jgi:hypothetical protein